MIYFVTGATGFIGKRLVAKLLEDTDAVVLLPDARCQRGAARRAPRVLARRPQAGDPDRGRSLPARPGRKQERSAQTQGQGQPLLSSGGALQARCERRGSEGRQRLRNPQRRRSGTTNWRRLLPPCQFHRGRRLVRRHLPRGHVRGSREPRPPILRHQTRLGAHRAYRVPCPVARLSPGHRRRRLAYRRSRQDRRALLLFQAHPEDAPAPAAMDAHHRPRGRTAQRRTRRFRRRRPGPHLAAPRSGRPLLPPDRPESDAGGRPAQHLRQGRPRPGHGHAHQRRAARLHTARSAPDHDGLDAGTAHPQRGDERSGTAQGHPSIRRTIRRASTPRRRRRRWPAVASRCRRWKPTRGGCGTIGNVTWTPTCSSTAACGVASRERWC